VDVSWQGFKSPLRHRFDLKPQVRGLRNSRSDLLVTDWSRKFSTGAKVGEWEGFDSHGRCWRARVFAALDRDQWLSDAWAV